MIVYKWSEFKNFVDAKSLSIQFAEFDNRYMLVAVDGPFCLEYAMPKNNNADQTDFETNYKTKGNETLSPFINEMPATTVNRIKAGYSIYVTGIADNIAAGTHGGGVKLSFDSSTPTVDFQLLNHWYAIGAEATWVNCTEDNYFDAILYAPATVPSAQAGGEYIVSNGVIVPVGVGNGTHDLDLTAKIGSSNVLACSPVPIAGNTGYFNYDKDTNTITQAAGNGGYHLFAVDINFHAFGRYIWGSSNNGEKTQVSATDLVGKLLYNFWRVKVTLSKDGGALGSEKAKVKFILGAKGNI